MANVALRRGEACQPVSVHGGHFDIDVAARTGHAVYWPEPVIPVFRGLWFEKIARDRHSCMPCSELISDAAEAVHARLLVEAVGKPQFRNGTFENPLHRHYLDKLKKCLIWYNINTIHCASTAESMAGMLGDTYEIVRGYRAARSGIVDPSGQLGESHCHCGSVRHLVLVAHGIGQALEGSFHKSVEKLRATAHSVAETGRFGPQLRAGSHRVEFLPIQWRSSLVLDEGTIKALTLPNLEALRNGLNSTILDVLFFTSPVFCQQIIDSIVAEMNRVYDCFIARHPHFWENGGQISVLGHSLGSVISFDVLSNQTGQPPEDVEAGRAREIEFLEKKIAALREGTVTPSVLVNSGPSTIYGELHFPVKTLFCLGSPLGLFLAMRGYRAGQVNAQFADLKCRLLNIFHSHDPVAYRLEPLLNMPPAEPVSVNSFAKRDVLSLLQRFAIARAADQPVEPYCPFDAAMAGRVDFTMKPDLSLHEYLTAMDAHTSYWTSRDLAALLLHQVYHSVY